jgi:hypothetical protein
MTEFGYLLTIRELFGSARKWPTPYRNPPRNENAESGCSRRRGSTLGRDRLATGLVNSPCATLFELAEKSRARLFGETFSFPLFSSVYVDTQTDLRVFCAPVRVSLDGPSVTLFELFALARLLTSGWFSLVTK